MRAMKPSREFGRRLGLLSFMFVIAALVPCWSQSAAAKDVSIEVRDLVDGSSKYTHRLIIVHGCFVKEFEISVLQPCDARFDQFSKYSIWLDDIDQISQQAEQTKATFIAAESATVLKNGRGDLWKLESNRERPLSIVVEGEFQASRMRTFGHLDFYKNRFIIHRLLDYAEVEKHR
jgi:hypothetical protein